MIAAALTSSLLLSALPAGTGDHLHFGTHVGDFYPPIVLPSLDGKRALALSMFAGKKVLLVQFASW